MSEFRNMRTSRVCELVPTESCIQRRYLDQKAPFVTNVHAMPRNITIYNTHHHIHRSLAISYYENEHDWCSGCEIHLPDAPVPRVSRLL